MAWYSLASRVANESACIDTSNHTRENACSLGRCITSRIAYVPTRSIHGGCKPRIPRLAGADRVSIGRHVAKPERCPRTLHHVHLESKKGVEDKTSKSKNIKRIDQIVMQSQGLCQRPPLDVPLPQSHCAIFGRRCKHTTGWFERNASHVPGVTGESAGAFAALKVP